jgi:GTP-binding protein
MKFIDELVIEVASGSGGNGIVAFRREKFVPMGGPAGGDGGRGGSFIVEATDDLTTLYELSFKRSYAAQNGEQGGQKNMSGANGEDFVLKVPVGTLIYDYETNKLLFDLDHKNQREVVAKGGRGGYGNSRFATPVRRTPRIAEKGEPGKQLKLRLELKLLADVGLVGLPNAGKSTFLRAISNAKPKVADYPFTTLTPNLGIVKVENIPSFCVADIPGLIEGAHEGVGLGVHFLKHIERTRILLHLVDTSELDPDNITKNYDVIMNELKEFSPALVDKTVIVAANKIDLTDSRELFPIFKREMEKRGIKVFGISGVSREGIVELLKYLSGRLAETKAETKVVANEDEKLYRLESPFNIVEEGEGRWLVTGAEIERLVAMTDFTSDEAVMFFKRRLNKLGFMEALQGVEVLCDGDVFSIGEMEFEYWEFFN